MRDDGGGGGGSTPPSGKDRVQVAIAKLHDEAKRWFDAADDLEKATNNAKTLQCSKAAFSFLDLGIGVAQAYEEARKDFKKLAAEGESTLTELAKALKKAANDFEAEDKAGAHRIDKSADGWSMRG